MTLGHAILLMARYFLFEQVTIFNKWKSRSLLEQEVIIKNGDLLFHFSQFYQLSYEDPYTGGRPIYWVFIAQLVEYCSANAEATDWNPVEAPRYFFFWLLRNYLNCDSTAMVTYSFH